MNTSWSQTWRDIASVELTEALARIGTVRRLADGQVLYQQGDVGSELYGVQSGLVAVSIPTGDGAEGTMGLYAAGTWFGEVALFDDLPRPVSARARGPAEVLVVPAARLRELLDANPIWYRDFARVLCNKLRVAITHIEVGFLPISVRLVLRLLDLARTFGTPGVSGVAIDLKLPQDDLARMLGVTRQSVNKELVELEQRGWVVLGRAHIVVADPAAMLAHARQIGGAGVLAGLDNGSGRGGSLSAR